MAAPIMAGKAAKEAGKALTGDIYTRRWQSSVGTGKKKKVVDHELRVNPVSVGLGLIAAGVAATGAAIALWATQNKVAKTEGKDLKYRIVFNAIDGVITADSRVVVYKGSLPIATYLYKDRPTTWDGYLSGRLLSQGFTYQAHTYEVTGDGGAVYYVDYHSDDKNTYEITGRAGFLS